MYRHNHHRHQNFNCYKHNGTPYHNNGNYHNRYLLNRDGDIHPIRNHNRGYLLHRDRHLYPIWNHDSRHLSDCNLYRLRNHYRHTHWNRYIHTNIDRNRPNNNNIYLRFNSDLHPNWPYNNDNNKWNHSPSGHDVSDYYCVGLYLCYDSGNEWYYDYEAGEYYYLWDYEDRYHDGLLVVDLRRRMG